MSGRILLIDDRNSILKSISHVLEQFGHEVEVASDGKKGIEIFKSDNDFKLVITDIDMPGMDGNEVARQIRTWDESDTPIVAITGSIDDRIHRELFNLILSKPFTLDSLEKAVRLLI